MSGLSTLSAWTGKLSFQSIAVSGNELGLGEAPSGHNNAGTRTSYILFQNGGQQNILLFACLLALSPDFHLKMLLFFILVDEAKRAK